MFADPQDLDAFNVVLNKVPSGKVESISKFAGPDNTYVMTIHQNKTNNRFRREARLTLEKVATDALTGLTAARTASAIIAFDEPRGSYFTDAELVDMLYGLYSHLSASTNAGTKKLLNGEL